MFVSNTSLFVRNRNTIYSMVNLSLSERIKLIAEQAGTQTDLANSTGVSPQAISSLCRGLTKNMRLEHLFAMADSTGFSPRWIATGEGDMFSTDKIDSSEQKMLNRFRRLTEDNKKRILGQLALELSMQFTGDPDRLKSFDEATDKAPK